MSNKLDRATARLARLAQGQHGVVSAAQLEGLGISRATVSAWTRRGRLHRLHRGVYAVGHVAQSDLQRFMAAVLACGDAAALSHLSAAQLFGFLKLEAGPVHVTSPSTNGRARRREVVLHRSPSLAGRGQTTRRELIPVTTPRRTIEDLERTAEPYIVRRARRQAEFMKYRLGLPTDRTRSDLESDFLLFCQRCRLPRPEVNVRVGSYTVDFLWPRQMLVVETGFFAYHRGSQAFEDDHQRELDLRRAGFAVRRFTGAQIREHPDRVLADLTAALARRHGGAAS